jgi:hypothetical protein
MFHNYGPEDGIVQIIHALSRQSVADSGPLTNFKWSALERALQTEMRWAAVCPGKYLHCHFSMVAPTYRFESNTGNAGSNIKHVWMVASSASHSHHGVDNTL